MPQSPSAEQTRLGTVYGFSAYLLWGFMPLLFHFLRPASALEILSQRVVWSFVFCLVVMAFRGEFGWIRELAASPRRSLFFAAASIAIGINWGLFIYTVTVNRLMESSLGYFINPLTTVLVGVLLLKERLRTLQWIAIGVGAIAVGVLTVNYGALPALALGLALSFTTYSFIKNRVGIHTGALEGLTMETVFLFPPAVAYLIWLQVNGNPTFLTEGPTHTVLMMLTGPATAIPLLLFSGAARRVPLTTIGLMQFLAPVMQLLTAVFILHEHVPPTRWIGFGLVWLALVILTTDTFRAIHSRRQARVSARLAG